MTELLAYLRIAYSEYGESEYYEAFLMAFGRTGSKLLHFTT